MNIEKMKNIAENFPIMMGLITASVGAFFLLRGIYSKYFANSETGLISGIFYLVTYLLFFLGLVFLGSYYKKHFGEIKSKKMYFGYFIFALTWILGIFLNIAEYNLYINSQISFPFSISYLILSAGFFTLWFIYWRKLSWHQLIFAALFFILAFIFPVSNVHLDDTQQATVLITDNSMITVGAALIVSGIMDHLFLLRNVHPLPKEESIDERV